MSDETPASPTGRPMVPAAAAPWFAFAAGLFGLLGQTLPQHTIVATYAPAMSTLFTVLLGLTPGWRQQP